jgi:hypothetical protein
MLPIRNGNASSSSSGLEDLILLHLKVLEAQRLDSSCDLVNAESALWDDGLIEASQDCRFLFDRKREVDLVPEISPAAAIEFGLKWIYQSRLLEPACLVMLESLHGEYLILSHRNANKNNVILSPRPIEVV